LSQSEFLHELGRRNVCVHYDVEEFEADLRTLEKLSANSKTMTIVSDTSAITSLLQIKRTELLAQLYGASRS